MHTPYDLRRNALRQTFGYYYVARWVREHLYMRLFVRPFTAILALL